jgi:hypothetical protein
MATGDARPIPQKNVAYRITFPIFDADGDLVTGATGLDSEVSKDGGTFADCTNEATEIATASGMYYLDLTSTEMNADTVAIIVKTSTSGAKTTPIILYPEEAGDIRVNLTTWKGTAPNDLVSNRVDASIGAVAANAITAAAIATDAIDADAIAAGAIDAATFAAGAITAAAIADGAIDAATFAAGAINAAAIATDAIDADAIAAGAIDAAAIASNAISAAKIATGAITSAKFAAGAIDAAAIADGAIDAATFAAGAITAAAVATNAIDADAIAADAVTEIQSGLATAASIAALNNLSSAQAQAAAAAAISAAEPIDANVTQINGGATNGYNAILKLKQLDIQNSAGSALKAVSTGSNGNGAEFTGHGSGAGLANLGGADGIGQMNTGGSNSGNGVFNTATNGNGMYNKGVGEANCGMVNDAGTNGYGMQNLGDGYGSGLLNRGGATGIGQENIGVSSSVGLLNKGGATGHGQENRGGSTSGNGLVNTAAEEASGHGQVNIGLGTDKNGILNTGSGTGAGLSNVGGATGNGQVNQGGATSGAGLVNEATEGSGQRNIAGSASGNANAVENQAIGTGAGMYNVGGAGGAGMRNKGGDDGGAGMLNQGGNTSGSGLVNEALADGHGQENTGAGTDRNGILNTGDSNGYGQKNLGDGYGSGMQNRGGTNGDGLENIGYGSGNGQKNTGGLDGCGELIESYPYTDPSENASGLKITGNECPAVKVDSYAESAVVIRASVDQNVVEILAEGTGVALSLDSSTSGISLFAKEIGLPTGLDSGEASLTGMLTKIADDNDGADFDATTDSLQAIRDRGDVAWITGGSSLTAQAVRDAMALSPSTSATPAVGSIDLHLDTIQQDTTTDIPALIAALPTDSDVQVAAAAALTAYDPPTDAEMDAGFAALNDVSTVEVAAACDAAISANTDINNIDNGVNAIEAKLPVGAMAEETSVQQILTSIGTPVALDGGAATLAAMLTKMADDNDGADFDATTDSLERIAAVVGTSLRLTDTVDGTTVSLILQKLMAMADGRFAKNLPGANQITFYKRDNTTPLFVVEISTAGRNRISG